MDESQDVQCMEGPWLASMPFAQANRYVWTRLWDHGMRFEVAFGVCVPRRASSCLEFTGIHPSRPAGLAIDL